MRASQNEAWCSALLADGDKVVFYHDAYALLQSPIFLPPLLKCLMQFASDKNFEHAHRCYDQALQMNSESVRCPLHPFTPAVDAILE